jgi:hypothetical protein
MTIAELDEDSKYAIRFITISLLLSLCIGFIVGILVGHDDGYKDGKDFVCNSPQVPFRTVNLPACVGENTH